MKKNIIWLIVGVMIALFSTGCRTYVKKVEKIPPPPPAPAGKVGPPIS